MDFGAPPPFMGTIDEPPDPHDDLRLTVSDDEDDSQVLDVPSDIPSPPSPDSFKSVPPPRIPIVNGYAHSDKEPSPLASPSKSPDDDIRLEDVPPSKTSASQAHNCAVSQEDVIDSPQFTEDDVAAPTTSVAEETTPSVDAEVTLNSIVDETSSCEDVVSGFSEQEPTKETSCAPPVEILKLESVNNEDPPPLPDGGFDDDDDDFGDFADFVTAPVANEVASVPVVSAADDDEWGDFDAAPRPIAQNASTTSQSVDDDWGAFGAATENVEGAAESDDWAADFTSAPPPSTANIPPTEVLPRVPDLTELLADDSIWTADDDSTGEEENVESPPTEITSHFDREDLARANEVSGAGDVLSKGSHLWLALRIVEEAVALKYHWDSAQFQKNLLQHLKIDPTKIGRGSLPPLSTDAVLMPTPYTSNGSTRRSVALSANSGRAQFSTLTPSTVTSSAGSHLPNGSDEPVNAGPPSEAPSSTAGFTDHGKVETDDAQIGSSGCSVIMDMDFLSKCSVGPTASSVSSLQKDFDDLGLNTASGSSGADNKTDQRPSVLSTLLSSAVLSSSSRPSRPPSELSLDARALHDQLPDIDYLRAKMIMFPMGGGTTRQQ